MVAHTSQRAGSRGWWHIHHSELAHVRSSVAFDAGMLLPLLSRPRRPIFLSVLVRALCRFSVSDPKKPCLLSRPWCPLTCTRKRWDGYSQTQKTFGVQPVPSTGGLWLLGLCPVVLSHGGCCPSGARWGRGRVQVSECCAEAGGTERMRPSRGTHTLTDNCKAVCE